MVRAVPSREVSVITVEELAFGFASRRNPPLEARLRTFIDQNCEVVPIDAAIARQGGELRGAFASRGEVRMQADMLIAATAKVRGFVLATRNTRDFSGCGIRVLSPFAR